MRSDHRERDFPCKMWRCLAIVAALICVTLGFTSAAGAQVMSPSREQAYRAMLPAVADVATAKILSQKDLLLFTDAEMPKAYQKWQIDSDDGGPTGVHWVGYNMSMDVGEQEKGHGNGGNGNTEFPWAMTGGMTRNVPAETFKFLYLPKDKTGRRLPVVYWTEGLNGQMQEGVAWCFPRGAVVGEVLYQTGPDGYPYVFEIRTRTRVPSGWEPDVFRPFPTARDLSKRIKQVRPNWQSDRNLAAVVAHLDNPKPNLKTSRLSDVDHPTRRAFDSVAAVDKLPAMDERLVAELLKTTPFETCVTAEWRTGYRGEPCYAPTTEARFNIVPRNYLASHIEVTKQSCNRCHETTNKHVKAFDSPRTWYGRIRGSDGIFSFHPFAVSSISPNGTPRQVMTRAELARTGYIAAFNAEAHSPEVYARTIEE